MDNGQDMCGQRPGCIERGWDALRKARMCGHYARVLCTSWGHVCGCVYVHACMHAWCVVLLCVCLYPLNLNRKSGMMVLEGGPMDKEGVAVTTCTKELKPSLWWSPVEV